MKLHADPEATPVLPPIVSRPSPVDLLLLKKRSLWVSIVEGGFTTVFMTWTSGAVLTGYLLALGAGPRALAAAASMPLLVQFFSPLITWWASRVRNRIRYLQTCTALGRGLWIAAVFLPWMGFTRIEPALALVILVGVSGLLQAGTGPAWISLMGDTVPNEQRGRYFGFRNGIMSVVAMSASLAAGFYLDRAPSPGGFQFVLALGAVFALVGIVLYGWQVDPPRPIVRPSFAAALAEPFRDKGFLRFLRFSMFWSAAVMLASPFVIPYFLTHLGMTFTQVALWSAIAAICTLGAAPLWGRIADQVGHKTVLKITSLLVGAALPLCWILSAPGFLLFIWISGVVDAIAWGGYNTAAFNMSLVTAPARSRMMYLAVLGAATGLTGCAAGMLSGPLLERLQQWTFERGGVQWTGYHSLFLLSALLRSSAWRLLRGVPERPGRPLVEVLREYTQRGVSLVLQSRTGA
jgi:MFS family permease